MRRVVRQLEAEELEIVAKQRSMGGRPRIGVAVHHQAGGRSDGADVVDQRAVTRPQSAEHGPELRLDVVGDMAGIVRVGEAEVERIEQAPQAAEDIVAAARDEKMGEAA